MGCGASAVGQRYHAEPAVAIAVATNGASKARASKDSQPSAAEQIVESEPTVTFSSVSLPLGVRRFDMKDFETMQVLAETPESTVLCLRDRRPGHLGSLVAGKRARKGSAAEDYEREVNILHRLAESRTVVSLLGVAVSGLDRWIVLSLCGGGTLEVRLHRFPKTARNAALQMMQAVQHLHSQLICHLDLKPDNVLFDDDGCVRLCDFATARQLESEDQYVTCNCGTEGFKAPEVAGGKPYCGLRADVYSLGQVLQLVARTDPTWRECSKPFGEMVASEPARRRGLLVVHSEVFGSKRSVAPVTRAERSLLALQQELAFEPWKEDVAAMGLPRTGGDVRTAATRDRAGLAAFTPGATQPLGAGMAPISGKPGKPTTQKRSLQKSQSPEAGLFAPLNSA